uniref:Uncharacterized protein n=1 Tax=Helianthus annuus TaxID=4232 RepID=A0A251VSE3_HELAN
MELRHGMILKFSTIVTTYPPNLQLIQILNLNDQVFDNAKGFTLVCHERNPRKS